MITVRFKGDKDGDGPSVLVMNGVKFPKGEWVTVTDSHLAGKLPQNSHFEVKQADVVAIEPQESPKKRGRPKRVKDADNDRAGDEGTEANRGT